ncbi:MAG: hypothetical protein LBU28_01665 [Spirochaetaceae bacterium]|nr:hypothetical protein [Spirochaetaceae bacterium]
MKDIVPGRPTPAGELSKQGVTAVGGIAGGILLLVLRALPPVAGIIAGAVAGAVGLGALFSRDAGDRKPGLIITAAGLLGILAKAPVPLIRPVAAFALGIGALGLLALGVWKAFQFLRGLKSRS